VKFKIQNLIKGLLKIFFGIVVFITVISCNRFEKPEELKIRIIETSDLHGSFFPYDFIENELSQHSLAQIYTYIENERKNQNQVVILLDNGDILQGDPSVYFFNYEKTDGKHLVSEVFNFMKYDAATVGNHDIEPGHPVYDKLNKDFDFPWLAANAVSTKTGKPYFKPYTIIERQGVRVAVVGLITPAIPNWLPAKTWEGIEFQDMLESAKYWVDFLIKNEKPDVLVGLFHSGVNFTYNNQDAATPMNENASKLIAEQVPGFDIVFVGHDHHGWNEKLTNWAGNEVLLTGPTGHAENFAVADILLKLNQTTHHYSKTISGQLVDVEGLEADPVFVEKFKTQFEEIKKYVSAPVATFRQPLFSRDGLFGDSPFVDLTHEAQLEVTGAEISIAAPLSFDREIKEGEIFVGDMFKIYKYENMLYTMELGGQEIKDLLEYSAGLWFNQMKNADDNLLLFQKDSLGNYIKQEKGGSIKLKNAYYNFDNAEGIIYTVDVSKPVGDRVNIVSMANGQPFDFNKKFTVAMNSYRGNGGGGHLTTGAKIRSELLKDRILSATEKDFRFQLMKWFENKKEITPSTSNNWTILPEGWYKKACEKDFNLLFPVD